MRIGFKSRRLDDPIAEVRAAVAGGFDHIEFALTTVELDAECFRPRWLARLRQAARDSGITISVHGKGGISLCCAIPRVQRLYLDICDTMLEFCCGLEAKWLTLHVGKVGEPWSRPMVDSRLAIAAASLADFVPRSLAAGVPLALENLFALGPEALSFYLGAAPAELESLIRAHPPGAVGLLLDTGHAALGAGVEPWLFQLGDRLVGVHLHANDLEADLHAGLSPFLAASWHHPVTMLRSMGVSVPVVLEVDSSDRISSRAALRDFCPIG